MKLMITYEATIAIQLNALFSEKQLLDEYTFEQIKSIARAYTNSGK